MGHLYFGDNLEILREHIEDESVDLVYLDPPFNSKRDYNLLFKSPKGHTSDASITAFEDSWHWGAPAEREFYDILNQPNTNVSEMIQALRRFLGENDMMAYLVMMCSRLLELHRVLKPTGSLYLHCDPSASHYLKILLDGVFGVGNYQNEITWKRQSAHNDARHKYGIITDVLLYYAKSKKPYFNVVRTSLDPDYVKKFYRHKEGDRLYQLSDMSAPEGGGMASINKATGKPNGWYEWQGYQPPTRGWRYSPETMQKLHDENRIYYPEDGTGRPRLKRYLDENKGAPVTNLWDDITSIQAGNKEGLGYPTQKPLVLLERVIQASCPPGGVVLDPFCGCGTAIHAAEKLGRQWFGIDITHLAIAVIEERLRTYFPSINFQTHGTPRDLDSARDLARRDKYEFQYWVCHLLGAQPYQNKKKGADGGIDGIKYFQDVGNQHKKIVVSVKGGENVNVSMIRDLGHVVAREKAEIGFFITLAPPTRPMKEEAAKAGFYSPPFIGAKFPRIQILTIEGILRGTEQPLYPALERGGLQAKRSKGEAGKQLPLLLPYEGKKATDNMISETARPDTETVRWKGRRVKARAST